MLTKKRLLAIGEVLVTTAVLLALLSILGAPGSGVKPALSARPDVRDSLKDRSPVSVTAGAGISYYLDSPNEPITYSNNFIAQRGEWCEIDVIGSPEACADYHLLSSSLVTAPIHGDGGYALALTYAVTQTNSLASYYEHVFDGDWMTGTFFDLSIFDEFHFRVKGEGNTVGAGTQFYIRFMDQNWNMAYVLVSGVSSDWEEKVVDLKDLNINWHNMDWHHMREMTIIFENDRGNSGYIVSPLSGTLYFDDLVFVDKDDRDTSTDQFLDLLERRAFQYFWEYADPATGLIRERATEPEVASIASVGFGLTAICAAKERGWITHEAAYTRVLTTLNSFYDDPGDPNDLVVSGTHGLFYHFVNIHTGTPRWTDVDGVSTIDSALLMAGVLSVRQCFTETEIVTRATAIYEAADWPWFVNADPTPPDKQGKIYMCWTPEKGNVCPLSQLPDNGKWVWEGYNEALILYLLAISSPTHPLPADSWAKWASTYQWGTYEGYTLVVHGPGPLFAHQYPQAWLDLSCKRDAYVNYFNNSRSATLANRAYSQRVWYSNTLSNPPFALWGFTASDGPMTNICQGTTYAAYGYPPEPLRKDGTKINDGTIAPTAAGGSIVFTPAESISSLRYMYDRYHARLWGLFGLKDSLNVICEPGWFDNDYIGIDVGIMLLMIENQRTGLIWNDFMRNGEIVAAMSAVGFAPDSTCGYLPLVQK